MEIDVGQNIRAVRKEYGMNHDELARWVGVHRGYLYQLEKGIRTPSLAVLERIAKELRTEPAEFLRVKEPVG